jgi:hypothetical protein
MKRKQMNNISWKFKSWAIFILFAAIINASGLSNNLTNEIGFFKYGTRFLGIEYYIWFWGYLISYFIAYILHFLTFWLVKKSNKIQIPNSQLEDYFYCIAIFKFVTDKEQSSKSPSRLKNILLRVISPDYSFASNFKAILWSEKLNSECPRRKGEGHYNTISKKYIQCEEERGKYNCEIHQQKNRRKDFVIYSNWGNVVIACIICIIAIFKVEGVFYTFLVFHLLSRIIEVVFAFYKDVVGAKMNYSNLSIGYKSSNLKRGNRISLALHSYFEFILLFCCIYYLSGTYISNSFNNGSMTSFIDYFLYSMSVSAYNFSLDLGTTTFGKVIHVSQVFSSMTLVILSVATYIGMKDEMSEYEIIEWQEDDYI